VAGVRTPIPVSQLSKEMPEAYQQLLKVRELLEKHFRDMQDLEFTIEDNRLYILQTRNGKRTGLAAIKIAVDMVKEKLISKEEALLRIPADSLSHVLAPIFDRESARNAVKIATGLPAGPGAASGRLVLRAEEAVLRAHRGERVLLVRIETSPEDLRGMIAAEGILTARGGVSSHAALVARQMGKVCVCGASELRIDYAKKTVTASGHALGRATSFRSVARQCVCRKSSLPRNCLLVSGLLRPKKSANADYALLMQWADKCRKLTFAPLDTPSRSKKRNRLRRRHRLCGPSMFFEGDRRHHARMIPARNADDLKAQPKLLPYQKEDFIAIFRKLEGLPATIRLLDPPLHEFLPHDHAQQNALASNLGIAQEEISKRVHELHEFNPMLGHRGCRLGIVYPEISEMQARAIFEAAAQVQSEGIKVRPEVMIPLVGFPKELRLQIEIVNRVAREVAKQHNTKLKYLVGTMIEIPRAALAAEQIAEDAEFFSFGTNDLTQTALGMSRDDSGSFLPAYLEHEIIAAKPFASIDQEGVGELMKIARDRARKTRKGIKLGICGEHGGDPKSVKFCHAIGLDYVSCSPFRVPIARLAAAQAALEERK
jgi:pyruvate,orthophosphate dikinase